jgi:transcription termination factor NusB
MTDDVTAARPRSELDAGRASDLRGLRRNLYFPFLTQRDRADEMEDAMEALSEANYKSMDAPQLIAELERLARFPQLYDNVIERKASIAEELAARVQSPTVPTSIIVLETD